MVIMLMLYWATILLVVAGEISTLASQIRFVTVEPSSMQLLQYICYIL